MNFTINSSILAKAVAVVSKAQSGKNAIPVLDCILIESRNGKVRLTGSDAENYLSCSLDAVSTDGEMILALDSKQLYMSIKELGDQPITIETLTGLDVTINYLNGKFSLMSQDAAVYPPNQLRRTQFTAFSVDTEYVRDGLDRCVWAVANDELRPQMNGVYFDTQKEGFVMVGSDGHKLVKNQFPNSEQIEGASFIILPKAIKILKDITKDTQAISIEVAEDKSVATIYAGTYTLSTRLVDKKYPNYGSVIPKNLPLEAVVNIQDLRSAVTRVLVFASNTSSLVKLQFADNNLTISAQDIDFSTSAEEKMNVEYNAAPMAIGFDGTILKQLLGEMPGENVRISMMDASRAAIFTPEEKGDGGEDILMLLMPMLLND